MKTEMRYTVTIKFKRFVNDKFTGNVKDLIEEVKTLSEAKSYKNIIDNSVEIAFVTDNINGKQILNLINS